MDELTGDGVLLSRFTDGGNGRQRRQQTDGTG